MQTAQQLRKKPLVMGGLIELIEAVEMFVVHILVVVDSKLLGNLCAGGPFIDAAFNLGWQVSMTQMPAQL